MSLHNGVTLVANARALHEQVDARGQDLQTNPALLEKHVNVARLVPAGDAGYTTDAL
jgi:hypothetical protein